MNRSIDISSGTILRAVFILLFLWFLFIVRDILMLVVISIIIVSAIDPIVDWFQKKKVPRSVTVLIIYIIFFFIIGFSISLLVPSLAKEVRGLSENFPQMSAKFSGYFKNVRDFAAANNFQQNASGFISNLNDRLTQATSDILSQSILFLGGIFSFLVIFSVAFYMSVQEKGIKKFFASLAPEEHQEYVSGLIERIQRKMGYWLQGQFILMLIVFLIDYVGLLIIGVPYALILALVAGLLEIIPYIGPIISAILAFAITFLHDPITGFVVLALFALVQQLEGYVIAPLVMKKAVGLNPVVVILALMIGAKLAGVTGIIIAVPVATAIGEVVNDLTRKDAGALELEKNKQD